MTHFLSSLESDYFDPVTKRYCWPPGKNATGRQMLFSGPNYERDYRSSIAEDHLYVGIGTMSPEGTSEIAYLTRPSWERPPHLYRKHERVGGIGWGIPKYSDPATPLSGHQIIRGEFWTAREDWHTHMYQNPWTPMPTSYGRRISSAPVRRTSSALRTPIRSPTNSSTHSGSLNFQAPKAEPDFQETALTSDRGLSSSASNNSL